MTRVLSYNIQLGGTPRIEQLSAIISAAQPDVVGLVEATDPHVVEELACRLDMQFCLTEHGRKYNDWQVGLLSKLPIIHTKVHTYPGIFTRRHLLEVCVEEAPDKRMTIFVIHLTANFFLGRKSNIKRRQEVDKLLSIMEEHQGTPHLVMGDFNSLAPGETFKSSNLFRHYRRAVHQASAAPKIRNVRSLLRYILRRLIHISTDSRLLAPLFDRVSQVYIQGGIDLLYKAGYSDCYRQLHTDDPGYTFHSASPACRIDFIFASPELAKRLTECNILLKGNGVHSAEASDHMALYADFAKD